MSKAYFKLEQGMIWKKRRSDNGQRKTTAYRRYWVLLPVILLAWMLISCHQEYEYEMDPVESQEMGQTEDTGQTEDMDLTEGTEQASLVITEEDEEPAAKGLDPAERIARILQIQVPELYEGYPVDETFWCWMSKQYGMDFLNNFSEALWLYSDTDDLWYRLTGKSMHVLWMEFCRDHGYAGYLRENVVFVDTAKDNEVTIDFVGDINFDDNWYTMQAAKEAGGVEQCISPEIQKELQSADITVVNNEFTYSTGGEPLAGKTYTFRSEPSNVHLLQLFGADLVSLANNHSYDYGEEGFLETLEVLKEAGYPYMGAGRNLEEAAAVRYFVAGGRKIGFINATEIERSYHYTKMATKNTPGVLKTQQKDTLKNAIENAKKACDYMIAYIHWGGEGKIINDDGQEEIAGFLVEAGVDAIIGGHPHRLQGATFVEDVPVAYSLGNFWFSTGSLYTTIAQLRIDEKGELSLSFLPCVQRDLKTSLLTSEEEIREFYHYFADVSKDILIDDSGRILPREGQSFDRYPYASEEAYGLWNSFKDLDGVPIDIVGNRQEP